MLIPTFTGTVLDTDGTPLSGGQIQVLVDAEPVTIYADASFSTPLPNPVTLNSAGIAPAIFVDEPEVQVILLKGNVILREVTCSQAEAAFVELPVFGAPQVPNGKIYTYIGGSFSIPAVTYKDALGTEENENPVLLDGAGSANTSFFVPEASCITFLLTDEDGTPLVTLDGVKS